MFDAQCDLAALVYHDHQDPDAVLRDFEDWIRFADGMSVKLHCDRAALQAWWNGVSASDARRGARVPATVCEIAK